MSKFATVHKQAKPFVFTVNLYFLSVTSFSKVFNVFPLGPISKPTKLISGYSSWGIMTLSLTRTTGGL